MKSRPYVDQGIPRLRYRGGSLPLVREPPRVTVQILNLAEIRRHNTLHPALQPTDRILLRWGESGGTGLPNSEADIREVHYDPLPPDLQEAVDDVVTVSPWEQLTCKWYRTALDRQELAVQLRISRSQLYSDWRSALWYYRGRFESEKIFG